MRTHRMTDDEASAVLRGQAPQARHDLAPLADAVVTFRRASFDTPPQPSAELAARLDLERASRISIDRLSTSTSVASPAMQAPAPRTGRRRVALGAFAGLGLAAKIAIGAGAALAVGVGGAGAAGAAGVLPTPAQEVFEQVTGHPGGDSVSDSGLEHSEFGLETAEEARQQGETKREEAQQKAEEQRQAGLETAEEASQAGQEAAEDAGPTGQEAAEHASETGLETAEEKTPENVPPAPGGPKG